MEAIKPRQIINYDAGIVLIDLHQLNVKTTSNQYKSATLNARQPRINERTDPQEQQPHQHPLSNQMIEQINIALEQKRVRNFSNLGHVKPAVGD